MSTEIGDGIYRDSFNLTTDSGGGFTFSHTNIPENIAEWLGFTLQPALSSDFAHITNVTGDPEVNSDTGYVNFTISGNAALNDAEVVINCVYKPA